MKHEDIRGYIGSRMQCGGARRIVFTEGKTAGTRAVLVENGSGLSFTVLEDRCLDIYSLNLKGSNIPFISKCGPVHPAYYDAEGSEWLRSFQVGFLVTCGLNQVGDPCRYKDSQFGLHGPVSNIPAEDIRIIDDNDTISIFGSVRQYKFQTEDLLLERCIAVTRGINRMTVTDTITNDGWTEQPFMLLYHFNFGYPMLNEDTGLILPLSDIEGWNRYSETVVEKHLEMNRPEATYKEQTFIHKICDINQKTVILITDDKHDPRKAVRFEYDPSELPFITQWKHFKPGEYVMAVEPCNNHVRGVSWESENGTLKTIMPGEKKSISFTIDFLDDPDELRILV